MRILQDPIFQTVINKIEGWENRDVEDDNLKNMPGKS